MSKYDWMLHQQRDYLASMQSHSSLTASVAIVENESIGRVRHNLFQVFLDVTVVSCIDLRLR